MNGSPRIMRWLKSCAGDRVDEVDGVEPFDAIHRLTFLICHLVSCHFADGSSDPAAIHENETK
jgi:hypothetical protein